MACKPPATIAANEGAPAPPGVASRAQEHARLSPKPLSGNLSSRTAIAIMRMRTAVMVQPGVRFKPWAACLRSWGATSRNVPAAAPSNATRCGRRGDAVQRPAHGRTWLWAQHQLMAKATKRRWRQSLGPLVGGRDGVRYDCALQAGSRRFANLQLRAEPPGYSKSSGKNARLVCLGRRFRGGPTSSASRATRRGSAAARLFLLAPP